MKLVQTIEGTFSPSVIDVSNKKVCVGDGCGSLINAIGSCEFTSHYANVLSGKGNMVRVTVEVWERDVR